MTLARPSGSIETGVPSKSVPDTSGAGRPTAGSLSGPWNGGSGSPVMTGGWTATADPMPPRNRCSGCRPRRARPQRRAAAARGSTGARQDDGQDRGDDDRDGDETRQQPAGRGRAALARAPRRRAGGLAASASIAGGLGHRSLHRSVSSGSRTRSSVRMRRKAISASVGRLKMPKTRNQTTVHGTATAHAPVSREGIHSRTTW